MKYISGDISTLLNASITGATDRIVTQISIDSRSINFNSSQTIFIALVGNIVDGHEYVKSAYDLGVRVFLIQKNVDLPKDASIIKVDDTLNALQSWAKSHRQKFDIPVVAITGSNGKTITKEWLSKLLDNYYKVVKSPKSFNSQIGVPLSVLQMDESHEVAVFEAGISQPNEMKFLEEILKPTICILTNIGDAHSSGFEGEGIKNLEEKLREKSILFSDCKQLIYYKDNSSTPKVLDGLNLLIGKEQHQPYSYTLLNNGKVAYTFFGKSMEIAVPFTDQASIQNILASISVLALLGIDISKIENELSLLTRVQMRMETKSGKWNSTLINDAYNFDLQSLNNAVQYLKQIRANKPLIILSDIEENESKNSLYHKVVDILKSIDHELITVGDSAGILSQLIDTHTLHFNTTDDVQLDRSDIENKTILLKGARSFKFEKLYNKLSAQSHSTYLEIDLSAMEHNLSEYASLIPQETQIMTVVKASAYGSGAQELAKHLQHRQVAYLAVAYVDEGIELRESGIQSPILVLNPDLDQLDEIISFDLESEVYSILQLEQISTKRLDKRDNYFPKVHIKLDTGMHRLGFQEKDLSKLIEVLSSSDLEVASIFSHLASSDNPDHKSYTLQQIHLFDKMYTELTKALGYFPLKHLANTAAISRFPEIHYDMVRLGLGLYGIDSNEAISARLERVHTLKSKIIQIKHLLEGDTLGYNRTHIATKDSIIAVINIGYADGLMRNSGNGKHKVYLKGMYVPIVGNVCMDLTMIDITGVEDVKVGDDVEVFGKMVDITELAAVNETIPYELLAGISSRVKKVYVRS